MDSERFAARLHEAAGTHHTVYRITGGDDPDRASRYADRERWESWDAERPPTIA